MTRHPATGALRAQGKHAAFLDTLSVNMLTVHIFSREKPFPDLTVHPYTL